MTDTTGTPTGTVTTKGAWDPEAPSPHHVLGPGALLPVMTLRESAIAHNTAVMQAFVERHGLVFAPHMKTHMSPDLAHRQVDAGAWGVTLASVQQAMVAWEHDLRHVLIANEVLDPAGLAWLATRRSVDPASDLLCYVDSTAGVAAAAEAARTTGGELHLLVEVGFPGGRTGARTDDTAREVADAVAATDRLVLRGVSGYEGGLPTVDDARAYVERVRAVGESVRHLVPGERAVLSLGGSAYFDAVADGVAGHPDDVDVVLRSGSYLTHDDGTYEHKTPFNRIPAEGDLTAAIEVWARVTSTPEPGLALVAAGKRDVPYDEGMPVVRETRPGGAVQVPGTRPAAGTLTVTRMDDQHLYLAVSEDAAPLTPGDVVVLGVSHPCTAFDKWRQVHLLADDDTVTGSLTTWF